MSSYYNVCLGIVSTELTLLWLSACFSFYVIKNTARVKTLLCVSYVCLCVCKCMWVILFLLRCFHTVEENSSIFSLTAVC